MLSAVRAGLGLGMMLAPGTAARIWFGERSSPSSTRAALRALGARELALGVGTLGALQAGLPVTPWLRAGVLSDAADAVNGLLFLDEVPPLLRLGWVAAPAAAALYGARLADDLD